MDTQSSKEALTGSPRIDSRENKSQGWLEGWWSRFSYKRIVGWLIIVVILDSIIIFSLLNSGNNKLIEVGYDAIKLSIQLFLLVLFGGLIVQDYNRAREKKEARNEFKRTVLRELSRAYSDVKGVRRIIRANCVSSSQSAGEKDCIGPEVYKENLATINATQLDLEILKRELRAIKAVFDRNDELISHVRAMEKYLHLVLEEYEEKMTSGEKKTLSLSRLPKLYAMIIRDEENKKDSEGNEIKADFQVFYQSYQDALEIIQEERLKIS